MTFCVLKCEKLTFRQRIKGGKGHTETVKELFHTWNDIEQFESKDENTFNAFSATIGNSLSKPQN